MLLTRFQEDPAMGTFLQFLEQDITRHPEHIKPLAADLFARGAGLVAGMNVDLDEELNFDDE